MAEILDVLRGRYVASPQWLKRAAAPFLALLPADIRWGGTYRRYREQIERSEIDADFVAAYRLERIRALLELCWLRSPYYRATFEKIFGRAFDPRIFVYDDMNQLPVLDKTRIRENPEALLVRPLAQLDTVSTSGTSGRPFKFYLDRDRGAKEWAFYHHVWGRIGYLRSHRRAVLRGIYIPNADAKPWAYDPALRELQLSPFQLTAETMDRYLALIAAYRINFLHGYPSAISILANHALRQGWVPPRSLMGVISISESLLQHQRQLIKKAFPGAAVMAHYGMSEKVAYAGELPRLPDHYEFEPLYGHTELLDDEGRSVTTPGHIGRIVATGFLSEGMPFVRYDTGDMAELVRLPSPENCFRLRVRGIRSRWGQEFLVARSGALMSIASINVHSPIYARIREFQFFQDTPGEATVRVVPLDGYAERDIRPFVEEIQRKVGAGVSFRLELCDAIAANTRGKRPFIEQKLSIGLGAC